ncbi:MAG: CBS domain-containing protein [Chloroflexi bacterium]|nr:CBS domain-containing protein [Chloroflexota bacterium]MDA1296489.1 CBS domain-containing protein [Chloroflexota bacterium]
MQFLSSVEHIMNAHSPVIHKDESIASARAVIDANNGNPVAVVGPDGALVGMLSSDALLRDGPATAGQLASRARMTVAPHESAFSVVSRMLSRRIDWVPVIKQGKVVGTISRSCVKSAFGETHTA